MIAAIGLIAEGAIDTSCPVNLIVMKTRLCGSCGSTDFYDIVCAVEQYDAELIVIVANAVKQQAQFFSKKTAMRKTMIMHFSSRRSAVTSAVVTYVNAEIIHASSTKDAVLTIASIGAAHHAAAQSVFWYFQ